MCLRKRRGLGRSPRITSSGDPGPQGAGSSLNQKRICPIHGEPVQFSVEKAGKGSVVKFAASTWRIKEIGEDAALLEAAEPQSDSVSFEYGGKGIGLETFLNDEMWAMIHADEFPDDLFLKGLGDTMNSARAKARDLCGPEGIPMSAGQDRTVYYTFAGALVNEAVALITEQEDYKVGDHWLEVRASIDWKAIPTEPEKYEPVFDGMFHPSMDQSIFQVMLPTDLQVREYVQEWLKDKAVPRVLKRLAESKPVEIRLDDWPFR